MTGKIRTLALLGFFLIPLGACGLMGGIFEIGLWVGIIFVGAIVVMAAIARRKRRGGGPPPPV